MGELKIPNHVAIIMDGNGRWASQKGRPRIFGHSKGVESFDKIVRYGKKIGIKFMTFYAFSNENWQRPAKEVSFLMELFRNKLKKSILDENNGIKINIIGEKQNLPNEILRLSESLQEKTKFNDEMVLNLAISYGSRQEILNATRRIAGQCVKKEINIENIDEDVFNKYLYTSGQPDVDLLIRTGGEQRISNFLLWQISYAELFFTKTYWPDFSESNLDEAIEEFNNRSRRFGKL